MVNVTLICVGKLKEKYLRDGCAEYIKRLQTFCKINVIEIDEVRLPDNPSAAQILACIENEGKRITAKLPSGAHLITMCIEGKQSHLRLSMSKMTFPHQFARMMLLEQIYRAFHIINNGKYHK